MTVTVTADVGVGVGLYQAALDQPSDGCVTTGYEDGELLVEFSLR